MSTTYTTKNPFVIALACIVILAAFAVIFVGAGILLAGALAYVAVICAGMAATSVIGWVFKCFRPSPRIRTWRDRANEGRLIKKF